MAPHASGALKRKLFNGYLPPSTTPKKRKILNNCVQNSFVPLLRTQHISNEDTLTNPPDELTIVLGDTNISASGMEPSPYKPGELERELYYHGLFDPPKLIARTSSAPWSQVQGPDTEMPQQPTKSFRAIKQHEILSKWSDSVRSNIIRALDGCNWRCFYPIRIGYRDVNFHPRREYYPVVLIVAVDEVDMEWERAIEIALACREVLRTADIPDVEVELQQATVTRLAESRKLLEKKVDNKHWLHEYARDLDPCAAKINKAMLPVHSSLGYRIEQAPRGASGTMGLHLQLDGDKSKTYGLVSRHVAIASKEMEIMDYKKQDGDQYCLELAVPLSALETCLENLKVARGVIKYLLVPIQRKINELRASEKDEQKADSFKSLIRYAESLERAVDDVYRAGDTGLLERTLGHVAFSPKLDSSSNNGFLRDWAIVELSISQFHQDPENKVYIGGEGMNRAITQHTALPHLDEYISEHLDDYGFLPIQGTRPWARKKRQAYRVGKSGRTTGLTFGLVGEIEAILRTPIAGEEDKITWAYLVVSYGWESEHNQHFSKPGDSGSCVFDFGGRAVGIVDAGQKSVDVKRFGRHYEGVDSTFPPKDSATSPAPKDFIDFDDSYGGEQSRGVDITFVTPIDWILDDIQEFTGYKAKIL